MELKILEMNKQTDQHLYYMYLLIRDNFHFNRTKIPIPEHFQAQRTKKESRKGRIAWQDCPPPPQVVDQLVPSDLVSPRPARLPRLAL